jgi:hypothetical protein
MKDNLASSRALQRVKFADVSIDNLDGTLVETFRSASAEVVEHNDVVPQTT